MAEATISADKRSVTVTAPSGGYDAGEVIQLADGRAGFVLGLNAIAAGEAAEIQVAGQVTLDKTSGVVVLKGDELFWDRSADTATPLKAVTGADFPIGVSLQDVASAVTSVVVDLNVKPVYVIDVMRDPADTVIVLTAGTVEMFQGPGYLKATFSATAEAQKVDIMSKQSIPVTVPFIVEGRVAIYDIGDNAALDINIGIANGTHATDADAITESCFLHLDGTALDILAESDDGTTEVAATDTTVDAVDDTFFDFRIDCRDLTDIQIYINGVNVLPASVFKLNAATGPLKLLAHMEKTSDNTTADIRVSHLAIRAMDAE